MALSKRVEANGFTLQVVHRRFPAKSRAAGRSDARQSGGISATATEHLVAGASIDEAASRSGFADVTHFVDSFQSMFGLSPSELIGLGTWLAP